MDNSQIPRDPSVEKMTDWKNEPSLLTLKTDLEASRTSHDDQISRIQHWRDLMDIKGKARPPKVEGRSTIQPKLIRRQAEWRYSALSEPFLGSDKLFEVTPVTFEDEKSAHQNELVLNWQFRTKMNMVNLIDDYVRATVDEGTSIVRLGWKRVTKTVQEEVPVWDYYAVQDEENAQILQQALQLKTEDHRTYDEQVGPDVKAAVDYYEETMMPVRAVQSGTQMVDKEIVVDNKPTVEVVNPDNVYIDPSCNGDIDKALFVIVSFETNQAELKKNPERYRNIDQINWEDAAPITQPDHATATPNDYNFQDAMRKKVVAYEYWGFYDIDGTGELKPIVATWIGNVMIRMEHNPFPDEKVPFVLVPYLPKKRELYGEPDAEVLEDNQKILGATTRGMVDLLGRSANGQQGFAKGMLDPVNRRRYDKGQDYEFNLNMPTNQGVIEHKFPEIPQSAMLMLNLQNQEAEALSGVKSFSGGISGTAFGDVARGIQSALDAAAKREMAILRRLAKGMSEIGTKIIAMNAEFLSEEEVVRVTNSEFVRIRREDLKGNFDLKVDISTAEVDNSKAQDLGFMLQTMGPNMDPTISMKVLGEIARLKRMPVLAHELNTWQPQPDPLEEKRKELEIQKLQFELEELQAKAALNRAKAQAELSNIDQKRLDYVEQETGTAHARNMEEHQAQAKGNQDLEVTKALLHPKKEGEGDPNVAAAVGYNQLSDNMEDERNSGYPQTGMYPRQVDDSGFKLEP